MAEQACCIATSRDVSCILTCFVGVDAFLLLQYASFRLPSKHSGDWFAHDEGGGAGSRPDLEIGELPYEFPLWPCSH
jgi:hypothetical protein